MSKLGWTSAAWTRPSTRTKSSASKPQVSIDAHPARRVKTQQRPDSKTAQAKSMNRERRVTPEERLARERKRERVRRSKNTTYAKSKVAGVSSIVESKSSSSKVSTARLKSETKLTRKHKARKKSTWLGRDTPPVSEEEYSNLPIQIQRKYFSDLERLHIAYSSVNQAQTFSSCSSTTNTGNHPPSTLRSSAHRHYHRQNTTHAPVAPHLDAPSTTASSSQRRSQQSGVNCSTISFGDILTSQAEAQWYNTLPDKARHQLFSISEQDVLAETLRDTQRLRLSQHDPADRKASRAVRHNQKIALSPYISSSDDSDFIKHKSCRRRQPQQNMATIRKRSDTELPAFNRHSIIFRSNSPHGLPWDTPANPMPAPKAPLLTTHRRSRSFATLASAGKLSCDATAVATDPDAVYYQNPEARHKLRQYLASPQRFDEALTFGFPSESRSETPQNYDYRSASANAHYDTSSSYMEAPDLEDYRSYDTSDTGTDSPATPGDADFSWRASKFNRVSIFGSLDTDSMPSFDLKFATERPKADPIILKPPPLMNREMTLRMTLTRPDLRANQEDMYGYSSPTSNEDPLTLDRLPPPIEDISGTRGAFGPSGIDKDHRNPKHYEASQSTRRSAKGKDSSGISRFFKKLRGH